MLLFWTLILGSLSAITFATSLPSNITSNNQIQVYCYDQRPENQPQRLPIVSLDCFTLARKLVRRTRFPEMQIGWSYDGNKGVKLPKRFTEKTCCFQIDLPRGRRLGVWEASFKDIAFTSNEIAAPCAYDGLHLGGMTKLGSKAVLDLYVYGVEYEPPESTESIESQ